MTSRFPGLCTEREAGVHHSGTIVFYGRMQAAAPGRSAGQSHGGSRGRHTGEVRHDDVRRLLRKVSGEA